MKKLLFTISSIAILSCIQVSNTYASEANKLSFDASFIIDALNNSQGGIKNGSALLTNTDISASYEHSSGLSFFANILANTGGSFSDNYIGDIHVASNIDTTPAIRLFEAYVSKSFNDSFNVKFGLINQNGQFDVQEVGALFLNSSHGIGPDYSQNPVSIFPISSLGISSEFKAAKSLILRTAIFDAVPGNPNNGNEFSYISLSKAEGVNYIAEIEKSFNDNVLKLGYWGYSNKTPSLLSDNKRNQGYYAQLTTKIYKESEDQGLDAWIRAGKANQNISDLSGYIGGGLVYTGPFNGRNEDQIGFAIANANIGKDFNFLNGNNLEDEINYELTYSYKLKDGFFIQPDIQYIKKPSGILKDALVFGVRLSFGLDAFKN